MANKSQIGCICLLTLLLFSACASKVKPKVNHQPTQWDHQKINENLAAEAAQKPAVKTADEERSEALCQVFSKQEMIRAKRSGCRPLDPRLGHGENAFCCPQ